MKINEKHLRWLFPLLIAISFCVNYAGIFDKKMDTNGDNYHYYLLAYSLASGQGYYSTIGPVPEPHTHFPPGYPVFMSAFMRLFKANVVPLKMLNGALLLLSLLLLFRIVRKTTGRFGLWYALCACLLCTFHVLLLRWATILMSEMLYLTLSLGIIAICLDLDMEKVWQKNVRHILLLAGLCLLVASAYFVRTMGISVILAATLAFVVLAAKSFLARKREGTPKWWKPALAGALVVASFLVAMESWNLRNQKVVPGYKSDYLESFSIPSAQDTPEGKTAFWADRIGKNLASFVPFYIPTSVLNPAKAQLSRRNMDPKDRNWTAGLAVIAVILVGLLAMKGLQWLLISYFLITFGVLCVYPPQFADTRYFVPLIPLMVSAFIVGVGTITEWAVKKILHKEYGWVPPVTVVLLVCLLIPRYYKGQEFYRTVASYKSYENMPGLTVFQRYLDACTTCIDYPPKQRAAVLKPEIFYLYSNFHHAIPLPRSGTPEEVIQFLEDNQVNLVIVDTWFASTYRVMLPTLRKYPECFSFLWQEGEAESPTLLLSFVLPPDWQPKED